MKKFLAALIVAGNFLFMSPSYASIETYVGEGSATMSEAETQDVAVDRAKLKALRHAQEQAGVYIRSQSRMRDLELVDDEVEMLTGGIVKIISTNVKKTVLNDDVIQVFVTVTVQINTDDLQREIDKLLDKRKPKPPVDRPKPIEQPKPVDKPKPEKVEPPPAKIEQPAEELAPVEEPKPAEPITPPPVDEPTVDEEPAPAKLPAPEYGVKFFEAYAGKNQGINRSEKQAINLAEDRLRKKIVAFVMKYCEKQNLKISEDEALAAVNYSSKIISTRVEQGNGIYERLYVKGQINMRKLNEWLEKNSGR